MEVDTNGFFRSNASQGFVLLAAPAAEQLERSCAGLSLL